MKTWSKRWYAGMAAAWWWCGTALGAAEGAAGAVAPDEAAALRTIGLAVGAALAIAGSVLGAGYAVGRIGAAAIGAIVEKPELLTRSIIFLALAEGLAILGFAVAMMLLQRI